MRDAVRDAASEAGDVRSWGLQPATRWRCGIIGFGRIGRIYHEILRATASDWGLAVVGVADPAVDPTGIDEPLFRDYRALLETGVDAVLIATPPSTHFQIARDALLHGKHVLLEKPPTRTSTECAELVSLRTRQNAVLFFAFHARYNDAVALCRERLTGRRVRHVRAIYREDVRRFHPADGWVHDEGVWRDSGINLLSILTYLLPDCEGLCVQAAELFSGRPGTGETGARVRLSIGAEAIAHLELAWEEAETEERTISIATSVGELEIDISSDVLYENGSVVSGEASVHNSLEREYRRVLSHFHRCLVRGESVCSCKEMRLLESAYQVAQSS